MENSYTYEELLTRLGILQDESNNTENSNSQENIIQENTTNEEVTNDKENIDNDQQNEDSDMDNQNQNGYIKPEVTVDNFTAEVYTAKINISLRCRFPAAPIEGPKVSVPFLLLFFGY